MSVVAKKNIDGIVNLVPFPALIPHNDNQPLLDQTMFEKVNVQGEDTAQNDDLSIAALDPFVLIKFWPHLILAFQLILIQSKIGLIFYHSFSLQLIRRKL